MAHPQVGACGGMSEAVFEADPPFWFHRFHKAYAVGRQSTAAGDITATVQQLWGAGLVLRKSAWNQLAAEGFTFLESGRRGDTLGAGEDYELCCALRLAGWRIWYDPKIKLRHYMPAARLRWRYLRRLHRGGGRSSLGIDPYRFAISCTPEQIRGICGKKWLWQLLRSIYILIFRHGRSLVLDPFSGFEGNRAVLQCEREIARVIELLRRRSDYDRGIYHIKNAGWWKLKNNDEHAC